MAARVRDLVQQLGTRDFLRIRLGVGRPADKSEVSRYVLADFSAQDYDFIFDINRDFSNNCFTSNLVEFDWQLNKLNLLSIFLLTVELQILNKFFLPFDFFF